jgi:hypothetical protein
MWHRDGTAGADSGNRNDANTETTARASVSWEYYTVCFHWNLDAISCNCDSELDRIVRHEICHVLLNEMRMWGPPTFENSQAQDEAMKHEERSVTTIAAILLWCREAGFKDKKAPREK